MLSFLKNRRIVGPALYLAAAFLTWPAVVHAQTAPAILITEIQTEGTSSTDEFVEIYNYGDTDLNLKGWRLSKKTASGTEYNLLTAFPDFSLSSKSFVLVSHENYVGQSDLKYSTQQSISDNNTLLLYSDAGKTVVDLVGWGTASLFQGQAAASPAKGQSLQRKFDGEKFASSGDNSADFTAAPPGPGQTTLAEPAPGRLTLDVTPAVSGNGAPSASGPPSAPPNSGSTGLPLTLASPSTPKTQIIFNELFPNPTGADDAEFIELKNVGQASVDLTFWQIRENDSVFVFEPESSKERILSPGQIMNLPRAATNLALKNDEDQLILADARDRVIDKVRYSDAPDGASYINDAGSGIWRWSRQPTPGEENIFKKIPHPPKARLYLKGGQAGGPVVFDASDSFDPDGDIIRYEWEISGQGQVISRSDEIFSLILDQPGKYNVNLIIRDSTGYEDQINQALNLSSVSADTVKSAARPYKSPTPQAVGASAVKSAEIKKREPLPIKARPKKGAGQKQSGKTRLRAAVNNAGNAAIANVPIASLPNHVGEVVKIEGKITQLNKSSFYFSDHSGEVEVRFSSSAVLAASRHVTAHSFGSVTGLVRLANGRPIILTRSVNDVSLERPSQPSDDAGLPAWKPWLLPVTYGVMILAILIAWKLQKMKASPSP